MQAEGTDGQGRYHNETAVLWQYYCPSPQYICTRTSRFSQSLRKNWKFIKSLVIFLTVSAPSSSVNEALEMCVMVIFI